MSIRREARTMWGIQDKELNENILIEWGSRNNLLVYHAPTHSELNPNESPVLQNTSTYNFITRKLVNESHGLFLNLQVLSQQESNNEKKEQLIKISHKYRSILTECICNLSKVTESTALNDSERREYENQFEMFYNIELIWNLCEILFIDIMQPGLILQQLLQWIRFHFHDDDSSSEIMEYDTPENHPSFWKIIYSHILNGKLDEARRMLKIHTQSSQESFCLMDELLRKMPLFKSSLSQSVVEVGFRWRHWQEQCEKLLATGEFSHESNLETICKILCGNKKIFEELRELCGNWYRMMVSRLLYSDPCLTVNSLSDVAKECIDICVGINGLSQVDKILLAVLEFDLGQVMRECCNLNDNWWFVTHLTDLLYHCGYLEQINYGTRLREFYIIDYAGSLMSHKSLWQIGVDYFDHCPEMGRQYLEMYLERIPLSNHAKVTKILTIAKSRNMQQLVNSIYKVMGVQANRNKQLGTALCWAVQSKDINFMSYLADKFLIDYVNCGKFTSLDLLDNLGPSMLVSDKLTFLGKYREFHKFYEEKDFASATSLLVSLLSSKLVPKHFCITLLLDALPLLESTEVTFSSHQMYELLYSLEELIESSTFKRHQLSKNAQELEELKEKLNLLRFALGRNLAKAAIREGSYQDV
ncbi:nuclear pore complex protein Nup85 [Centruroides vittatus]|uniref:nuclear pore complex protein Nup85 n=1 Tax=Centruroides vittatus TaxID=120091 RepID=UPI00350E99EC